MSILDQDILRGSSRVCNWLSLHCLLPWVYDAQYIQPRSTTSNLINIKTPLRPTKLPGKAPLAIKRVLNPLQLKPTIIATVDICFAHYSDVIMDAIASQITSLTIVYSTVYLGTNQRTHSCSASLAFVRGIHWWPVNSPHKWPVTQKMFPFDDVVMQFYLYFVSLS